MTTNVEKNLFENVELVNPSDPGIDSEELVFFDESDTEIEQPSKEEVQNISERAIFNLHNWDVGKQEEVRETSSPTNSASPIYLSDDDENPIGCIVKKEEEDDSRSNMSAETVELNYKHDQFINGGMIDITEEDEIVTGPTSVDSETMIPLNPPDNMEPLNYEQYSLNEEQFEIVKDEEASSVAENADGSLGLVNDHGYSQNEEKSGGYCDGIVQDMLQKTGLAEIPAAVELLASYNELMENFIDDADSQMALYIQSMKNTLAAIKFSKEIEDDIQQEPSNDTKLITQDKIPEKEAAEDVNQDESKKEADENMPPAETAPDLHSELPAVTSVLNDSGLKSLELTSGPKEVLPIETVAAEEANLESEESREVVDYKHKVHKVSEFGTMLCDKAKEFLTKNFVNVELKEERDRFEEIMKESKKQFAELFVMLGLRKPFDNDQNESEEMLKRNEITKKKLLEGLSDSEHSGLESDDTSNLNREIQKRSPHTPAVVSSTNNNESDVETATSELPVLEKKLSSESELSESDSGDRNLDKEIAKLIDISSLNHAKPDRGTVSSKPRTKKLSKKKNKSVLDDIWESSDDENNKSYSSSSDESLRNISDEEEEMLRRQNLEIKSRLLADSDEDDTSDEGTNSDISSLVVTSDSDHDKKKKKNKKQDELKQQQEETSSVIDTNHSEKPADVTENETEILKEPEPSNDEKDDDKIEKPLDEIKKTQKHDEEILGEPIEDNKKKRSALSALDKDEREIFSKKFLELESPIKRKSGSMSSAPIRKQSSKDRDENYDDDVSSISGLDITMFERGANKEIDLEKIFGKRSSNDSTIPVPSTSAAITSLIQEKSTPSPAIQIEDEWISLSSDSDSEVSAQAISGIPKRKKLLTEEELQEETKKAAREEAERLKRLDKKNEILSQRLTQRATQDVFPQNDLVLDYDEKRNLEITVHHMLVDKLKPHQFDGIKFMYDTCYGSVADIPKSQGSGCILAHSMGLGKTLQLIALLHTLIRYPELKTRRVMVICPKSTIMNWAEEFQKWLGPIPGVSLKVFYLKDNLKSEQRVEVLEEWFDCKKPSVFLINYEAFRIMVNYGESKRFKVQDEALTKQMQARIKKFLLKPGPDLVVCDEGHIIKNQSGALNKAITKIGTKRRIVLTGTPIQNNLNEYYAMVDWIKPSFLGTIKEFNNLYANPIKDGQHKDSTSEMIKRMKGRSFVLNRKLSKFVQRKEASVLKDFLPGKYEYCIFVPLTKLQENLYEYFLKQNPLDSGKRLLPDYTALRKIWTHPKVLQYAYERAKRGENKFSEPQPPSNKRSNNQFDEGENEEPPDDVYDVSQGTTGVSSNWWSDFVSEDDMESLYSSNKMILLFEILRYCQQKGEKVLLFSAFVAVLNVVEEFMKKISNQDGNPKAQQYGYSHYKTSWVEGRDYYRMDGKTPKELRHRMVNSFNDKSNSNLRVFLISSKAGGQGINLIGANRCIILDTSWNPANDQQNIFRIFRLGQPKTCYIYRLIGQGTMEEKVYSRSVTKQAMSGRVVDKKQIDRHYELNELSELYTLTKTDISKRPKPSVPSDDILKYLLHSHPGRAYKYHEHDTLLENKPDQDLNDDERDEAWKAYEEEMKRGTSRFAAINNFPNGQMLPGSLGSSAGLSSIGMGMRPDLYGNGLNFYGGGASSALDTGLFSPLFQPPPPSASEYSDFLRTFLPTFDISGVFRNSVPSPSSNATTSSSTLLRNQLNNPLMALGSFTNNQPTSIQNKNQPAAAIAPSFSYSPMGPSTSLRAAMPTGSPLSFSSSARVTDLATIVPSQPKALKQRRNSKGKAPTTPTLSTSNAQRTNGNYSRSLDSLTNVSQNSLVDLSILPNSNVPSPVRPTMKAPFTARSVITPKGNGNILPKDTKSQTSSAAAVGKKIVLTSGPPQSTLSTQISVKNVNAINASANAIKSLPNATTITASATSQFNRPNAPGNLQLNASRISLTKSPSLVKIPQIPGRRELPGSSKPLTPKSPLNLSKNVKTSNVRVMPNVSPSNPTNQNRQKPNLAQNKLSGNQTAQFNTPSISTGSNPPVVIPSPNRNKLIKQVNPQTSVTNSPTAQRLINQTRNQQNKLNSPIAPVVRDNAITITKIGSSVTSSPNENQSKLPSSLTLKQKASINRLRLAQQEPSTSRGARIIVPQKRPLENPSPQRYLVDQVGTPSKRIKLGTRSVKIIPRNPLQHAGPQIIEDIVEIE